MEDKVTIIRSEYERLQSRELESKRINKTVRLLPEEFALLKIVRHIENDT